MNHTQSIKWQKYESRTKSYVKKYRYPEVRGSEEDWGVSPEEVSGDLSKSCETRWLILTKENEWEKIEKEEKRIEEKGGDEKRTKENVWKREDREKKKGSKLVYFVDESEGRRAEVILLHERLHSFHAILHLLFIMTRIIVSKRVRRERTIQ